MRTRRFILVAAVVLATAGCHRERNPLEPAPLEEPAVGQPNAIADTVADVTVTAAVDVWPGLRSVLDDVTPVHLTVHNRSDRPVRLHLSDIALVDETGLRYAALPLYLVDGSAEVVRYDHAPRPAFRGSRYYLADPYTPYYAGFTVWDYRNPYAPYDYEGHYSYWDRIPLPTQKMVDLAIPEGVVAPDGHVSGFVYFERVDPVSDRVWLEYDLVDPDIGREFGEVDLAFDVR